MLVWRIYDFMTIRTLVWARNRAYDSISSSTTPISLQGVSLSKRHGARFDLLRDHRAEGPTRSRLPMAPSAYAAEESHWEHGCAHRNRSQVRLWGASLGRRCWMIKAASS